MGQITVSLPDELDMQLRQYAEMRGYSSVSSLVAEALREKFDATGPLDFWSRVLLVVQLENQRLIQRLIEGKEEFKSGDWDRDNLLEALILGYQSEYRSGFDYLNSDEVVPSTSKYVIDVLNMYADLQNSVADSNNAELTKAVRFHGFDGNHETQLMEFARYLRKNRRFAHIACTNEDLNSHGMGPDYRAMLTRYRSVRASVRDQFQPLDESAIYEVLARHKRRSD